MKKRFKRPLLLLFRITRWKLLLYALIIFTASIALYVSINDPLLRVAAPIALIAVYEIAFRTLYRINVKKPFPEKFNMTGKDIPFEDHPYLPWVYRKNYAPPLDRKIYDDDRQGYMTGGIATNNLRHVNGPTGDRDVIMPKPDTMIRIACLGDSATCNYVPKANNDGMTSWPLELEHQLKGALPHKHIEVNNFGQGGYNTNEILIKFLFDTIDTQPDYVLLYHAFVNVRAYLTPGFDRDFSHIRRNISRHYSRRVTLAHWIPDFGLLFLRYLKGEFISYLNIKSDHIRMINRTDAIDRDMAPEGLKTFERNLETLILACKGRGITPIISTYQYYLYPEIADSDIHIKFRDIVMQENDIIRQMAHKHTIPLADIQALIPATGNNYIDMVHPTENGMVLMAQNFYDILHPLLERTNNANT